MKTSNINSITLSCKFHVVDLTGKNKQALIWAGKTT